MKDGLGEAAVEKIIHILVMSRHLPQSFPEAAQILHNVRHHWEENDTPDSLTYFAAWPITDYVATYGLNHPDISLPLLRHLTPLYTAEFAIRPFIEAHKKQTYEQLLIWCMDSNEHVRRLASEGIRPRLPWGKQLPSYIEDPTDVISLLENLRDDPSDYVRRSVANNLNDISKDHPEIVLETCERWLTPIVAPSTVCLGTPLQINIEITSTANKEQYIVLDYAIHFMKANGKAAPKVFKWKNLRLQAQQSVTLEKVHPLKAINTRRYYSGQHRVEIMINGKHLSDTNFELIVQ